MTPEQIGLYQAVLDELVHDVADAAAVGERKKGAILAAITALKQICNHPAAYRDDGQPLAGRSGQAGPPRGDRRVGVRRRRADPRLHPLRDVGPPPRRPPHRGHRHADRLLRRQPRPRTSATGSSPSSRGHGPRRAGAVAEGRRHRAQPDRGQPRRAVRPVVEPGRRGPGPRPRVAHRAEPHGHLAPPRVPRHRSTNASRRSSPASATSPSSCCRARARSPTSTPTNCASRSGCDPTSCSPRTTDEPAPPQRDPSHRRRPPAEARRRRRHLARPRDRCPTIEPITVPDEVGALLRSLGDPPTIGGNVVAGHYFTAVVERAAAVAAALALSADLLAEPSRRRRSGGLSRDAGRRGRPVGVRRRRGGRTGRCGARRRRCG